MVISGFLSVFIAFVPLVLVVVVDVEHAALQVGLGSLSGPKFVHLHRSHPNTCYARRNSGSLPLPSEMNVLNRTSYGVEFALKVLAWVWLDILHISRRKVYIEVLGLGWGGARKKPS